MSFCFPPADEVSLPVVGSDKLFPVRRVYCVGRNYAAHAREMGDDPTRDQPFFFCKDRTCVLPVSFESSAALNYPSATEQFEYEAELVVALQHGGYQLSQAEAVECVFGYAVGLDMTRRDLQAAAKAKGRPWESGKSFANSAPISPVVPRVEAALLEEGEIKLSVNGVIKQQSNLTHMIWSIAEIVVELSKQFELSAGDLIMTGTPEHVGAVKVGDALHVSIAEVGCISLHVT